MVTVDEIRARVQAADAVRIEVRAERAAKVAERHAGLAELRAVLADSEAEFKTAAAAALEVMSVDELADFAAVPKAELQRHAPAKVTSIKAGSTRRRPKRSVASAPDNTPSPSGE